MVDWRRAWSEIPFLNDSSSTVDWTDAGLTALGVVLVSIFEGIAELVASFFDAFLIQPALSVASSFSGIVSGGSSAFAGAVSPDAGWLVETFGFPGAIVVIAVGAYIVVWTIGVVR